MSTLKLPPLPEHPEPRIMEWTKLEMRTIKEYGEACAIAAIEAQGVPDGWRKEAKNLSSILAGMGEGSYDLETLYTEDQADGDGFVRRAADLLKLLASAPPAPQEDKLVKCSYGDNGYACCEGGPCAADVHNNSVLASDVQQEPLGFISPKQVERIIDPDGEFGAYIPMRKTPAGNFTLAVYTHPDHPAKPQPLSDEQICNLSATSPVLSGMHPIYLRDCVRAIEAAHGIKE